MGKIKTIKNNELIGGTDNTYIYPVTSTSAVYNSDGENVDTLLDGKLDKGSYTGSASDLKKEMDVTTTYSSSEFSQAVDPETGEANIYYRTIYKKKRRGEYRIEAKVWGSSSDQRLFRAFDINGNVLTAYNRNVQIGEEGQILDIVVNLGADVYSYSVAVVFIGSPSLSNAKLTTSSTQKTYFDTKTAKIEIVGNNSRLAKANGILSGFQRWGDSEKPYFKINFPDDSFSLDNGIAYSFDVVITNTPISTTIARPSFLKIRVELFRLETTILAPMISYLDGDVALMSNVSIYKKVSSSSGYIIPVVVVSAQGSVKGCFVENLVIKTMGANSPFLERFAISVEDSDILEGLTLVGDFTNYVVNPNLKNYANIVKKPFAFSGKMAEFTGDSITKGFTSGSTTTSYPYPRLFSEIVGMSYVNSAQGGALFCSGKNGVKTIVEQVQDANKSVDYLFIAGGVNDWQLDVPYSEFKTVIQGLCDYINANFSQNMQVIWITPINVGGSPYYNPVNTLNVYRNTLSEVVMEKDIYARFSLLQGSTFNFPDENGDYGLKMALFGDLLHPSELGYRQYCAALQNYLL